MSSRQVISQWPAVAGQPPSDPLTVSTDPHRAVRPQETISFVRISSIATTSESVLHPSVTSNANHSLLPRCLRNSSAYFAYFLLGWFDYSPDLLLKPCIFEARRPYRSKMYPISMTKYWEGRLQIIRQPFPIWIQS